MNLKNHCNLKIIDLKIVPIFETKRLVRLCTLSIFCSLKLFAFAAVPRSQLPAAIQIALRQAENQFELTLGQDCPTEKCFSRGCVYLSHESVDQARSGSLPGLGEAESAPGAQGQAQEYLTGMRCELAYENTIPTRDISVLIKRLEQKLSRGYTTVSIDAKPLPALPAALKVTPNPFPNSATATPAAIGATPELSNPSKQNPGLAAESPPYLHDLWKTLLPHFGWMIAIALVTLSVVVFLWALRRVGKASLEELTLQNLVNETESAQSEKQSNQNEEAVNGFDSNTNPEPAAIEAASNPAVLKSRSLEDEFKKIWQPKIARETLVFKELINRWLREKRHDLTSKFALLSQEDFALVLPHGNDLALERAELAAYMTRGAEYEIPSDEIFLRELKIGLAASYVAASSEGTLLTLVRDLKEQFGPEGIFEFVNQASEKSSAVFFSMIPEALQKASASLMSTESRLKLVKSLITNPRASQGDLTDLMTLLNQKILGGTLAVNIKSTDNSQTQKISFGRDLKVGRAISVLFPLLEKKDRLSLVESEKSRFNGSRPPWMQELFYHSMLLTTKPELIADVFLAFEARQIALWLSQTSMEVKAWVSQSLPASLLSAARTYRTNTSPQDLREREIAAIDDTWAAVINTELSQGRLSLEEIL